MQEKWIVPARFRILDGRALKIIALISMIIDHIGVALFPQQMIFRYIGRLAMPIYAFLLVEGAKHTGSVLRYMTRMGIIALISEYFFDVALKGQFPYWTHQNIFVELFIGLAMLEVIRVISSRFHMANMQRPVEKQLPGALLMLVQLLMLLAACIIANRVFADYGALGICIIYCFYFPTEPPYIQMLIAAFLLYIGGGIEPLAILALPIIMLYNGEKGHQPPAVKYAFYIMYPLHLAILALIRMSGIFGA